jgi:hypothetical protein
VHDRLLSAVSSNHGHAFRRILDALELPLERVVLQLPAATPQQGWLLNYVSDNYRRNGFRFAVNVNSPRDALGVLERLRPDVFKLDVRELQDKAGLAELLQRCAASGWRWCSSGWKRRSTWRPCANSARCRCLVAGAGLSARRAARGLAAGAGAARRLTLSSGPSCTALAPTPARCRCWLA